ncbi:basic proline-rich protein [Drosophila serrata]|uniref:basic proline-rich protein n=1 Tax=Drosophila serrata TaxID=7274 RepID=UPI000A1CFAB4|nr:basic proline-rich protein [Drosophila serrata]
MHLNLSYFMGLLLVLLCSVFVSSMPQAPCGPPPSGTPPPGTRPPGPPPGGMNCPPPTTANSG